MFYREDERKRLWKRSEIKYAEIAHQYLCCDVPTLDKCLDCKFLPEQCPNKAEIDRVAEPVISGL